jgi:hypothetical protein
VATTWSLSFQKIEQRNPAAAELLHLCAFLAPDHIPEELLKEGAPYWTPLLRSAVANLLAFNYMIEDLLVFSLVKRLTDIFGVLSSEVTVMRLILKDRLGDLPCIDS